MLPAGEANAHALSRRTLVEAVTALQALSPAAFVLVGAHAVHLRAPENELGLPAFTFDGDVVVNPKQITHSAKRSASVLRKLGSTCVTATAVSTSVRAWIPTWRRAGWKIGERYEQGPEAFIDVRKDIGDIYRLLQTSDADENAATLRVFRDNRHVSGSVRTGANYLRQLCTGTGAGLREFSELLGHSVGARTASASLAALVDEFVQAVELVLAEATEN